MRFISFAPFSPLLTKIGRRFGIDAHYFAKNSLIVTIGHGIAVLRGIVTGYLVTLLMPQQMYGEYQFVQSMIGTLGVFTMTGLPTSIAKSIAKKEEAPLRFTMKIHVFLSSLGALALLGVIPFLSRWGREDLWPLFVIAALLYVPSVVGPYFFGGIIIGTGKFATSLRTSLDIGAALVISVAAMLYFEPSPLMLLALMLGIPGIVYMIRLRKMIQAYPSEKHSWKLLRYGAELSFVTIPVTLSWYVDKLMISALFGLNQLALFSVALMIPEQLKIWAKELFPVSFSRQAHGADSIARRRKVTQAVGVMTLGAGAGILVYMLLSPYVIPILFPRYADTNIVLLTNIAAATLVTIPSSLFSQYLEARGMIRELQWANWLSAASLVGALFALVPSYGLIGAIIARGVFRLVYVAYCGIAMWVKPVQRA